MNSEPKMDSLSVFKLDLNVLVCKNWSRYILIYAGANVLAPRSLVVILAQLGPFYMQSPCSSCDCESFLGTPAYFHNLKFDVWLISDK